MISRAAHAAASLGVAFVLAFALLNAMPGDPRDRLEGAAVPAEQSERTRRALGLDAPPLERLVRTAASWLRGDLGVSFSRHRPVAAILGEALPPTLLLGGAALVLAYGLGLIGAAAVAGLPARLRRRLEAAILAAAVAPRFWLATMLALAAGASGGLLPSSHAGPPGSPSLAQALRHVLLPALALALPAAAVIARTALATMRREVESPHVRRARAGGGAGVGFWLRHVLRPAAAPVIGLAALDVPVLVSGAIVVETAFSWPGLGRVASEAVLAADYPLALACCAACAAAVVGARFGGEALARRLDPRLAEATSLESGAGA